MICQMFTSVRLHPKVKILSCLLIFFSLVSCAPSANDIVQDWKDRGWEIAKVHGVQGPIDRHGKLISERAKAIEASWIEKGIRKTKIYSQKNQSILVLRFFKTDGDQFVVVMKKKA